MINLLKLEYFLEFCALYAWGCKVCVLQPLLTSSIKCPPCNISYVETDLHGNMVLQPHPPPSYLVQEGEPLPAYTVYAASNKQGSITTYENVATTCFVAPPFCNYASEYRTIDGSCNNLEHPTWGMSHTAYSRIFPPHYRDRQHLLRHSKDGKPLPWVRILNTEFFPDKNVPDYRANSAAVEWGQLLTHDFTRLIQQGLYVLDCCNEIFKHNEQHCMQIFVPRNDSFYSKCGTTCEPLVRASTSFSGICNYGPMQQVNSQSSPMDLSMIYGAEQKYSEVVREYRGGRFLTQTYKGQTLPPKSWYPLKMCDPTQLNYCFGGGDPRVDQNTDLTVLIALIWKGHNTIANILQAIHPDWSDERLFQTTRKLQIALYEHVSMNEWFPIYINIDKLRKLGLVSKGYSKYRKDINMMTINSFVTSAFRAFHSAIASNVLLANSEYQVTASHPLGNLMKKPKMIFEGDNFDSLLRGMIVQPQQAIDRYFSIQVNGLLFQQGAPCATDLESLDIARGRDHGLAPYVHYLEVCTDIRATTFDDLKPVISEELIRLLAKYYDKVEDIDAFIGGMLENPAPGSQVGPTFECLTLEQLYRTKFGDRFWYEVADQPHSFTEDQMKEIRKSSFAQFICLNSNNITHVPRRAFLPLSESNPLVSCSEIPPVNIGIW